MQAQKTQPKAAPVAEKDVKEVDTRAVALHKAGVTAAGLTGACRTSIPFAFVSALGCACGVIAAGLTGAPTLGARACTG